MRPGGSLVTISGYFTIMSPHAITVFPCCLKRRVTLPSCATNFCRHRQTDQGVAAFEELNRNRVTRKSSRWIRIGGTRLPFRLLTPRPAGQPFMAHWPHLFDDSLFASAGYRARLLDDRHHRPDLGFPFGIRLPPRFQAPISAENTLHLGTVISQGPPSGQIYPCSFIRIGEICPEHSVPFTVSPARKRPFPRSK